MKKETKLIAMELLKIGSEFLVLVSVGGCIAAAFNPDGTPLAYVDKSIGFLIAGTVLAILRVKLSLKKED